MFQIENLDSWAGDMPIDNKDVDTLAEVIDYIESVVKSVREKFHGSDARAEIETNPNDSQADMTVYVMHGDHVYHVVNVFSS
ncbi:hypothetical protein TIN4_96 [Tsukamurella phage TIN4]|uniref:Uncharacterized protein n=2 Tax=Tinduovirus TIN3 TaxID=1982571 RepID=A0A0K0N6F0_9CAUD|nr:hypothetical protein AVT54_gp029 [Tsukamurella phage TIN3]YP_009604226.1 hypothetical protein FDH87_gp029 [Tsukamurella phage TIN4]AKJ71893.1 hypothetical protein TIN3_96 [Tsukamurella phage TIN3]AKJ72002.1 hypothetical protein TIN4_96 [Tsukamurella phage TIN4]